MTLYSMYKLPISPTDVLNPRLYLSVLVVLFWKHVYDVSCDKTILTGMYVFVHSTVKPAGSCNRPAFLRSRIRDPMRSTSLSC
jgi:hypothetical protein